ncbi:unnamed protein product [Cuscuta epithymum]|uniref:Peroxidase n=1 Tax=Cuscuta epithymum TaxID=186058 RepID=A0AAV0C8M1_9ASTE|nr:unnamed protein product [Cuscuta epithymum]
MGSFWVMILCIFGITGSVCSQLQEGFYSKTCPRAEKLISDFVHDHISKTPTLAAPLLRMHFHDCFVRGCDASVLLNFTSSTGNQTEKVAVPNQTLRGFDFIDRVKSIVEAECPQKVSCADIVALVARDSVVAIGGPSWDVPTGRRDGRVSNSSETSSIPPPTSNFTTLQTLFSNQGLNLTDLVLLSGAHTIGMSHCSSFSTRLYNFTGTVPSQDPALDSEYATALKKKCRSINDNTTIVEMDPGSFRTFDLSYYKGVLKRRGLFQSDSALLNSQTTRALVNQLASGSNEIFEAEFARSMEKMGRINVLTGSAGEIRKNCALVN